MADYQFLIGHWSCTNSYPGSGTANGTISYEMVQGAWLHAHQEVPASEVLREKYVEDTYTAWDGNQGSYVIVPISTQGPTGYLKSTGWHDNIMEVAGGQDFEGGRLPTIFTFHKASDTEFAVIVNLRAAGKPQHLLMEQHCKKN